MVLLNTTKWYLRVHNSLGPNWGSNCELYVCDVVIKTHWGICWELYVSFCFSLTLFTLYEEILCNGNTSQLSLGPFLKMSFWSKKSHCGFMHSMICVWRDEMTKVRLRREKRGINKYCNYIIIWKREERFKYKNKN